MVTEPLISAPTASSGREDRLALGYMFIAVISFSVIPLAIELVGAGEAPFLFTAIWQLGVVVGCLLVLAKLSWTLFTESSLSIIKDRLVPPGPRRATGRSLMTLVDFRVLLAVIGSCDYAFFAWSLRHIDVTVATILYASWPTALLVLAAMLVRKPGESDPDGETNSDLPWRKVVEFFALSIVSFGGLLFVIAAETGGFTRLGNAIPTGLLGFIMAAGAMVLAALKGFGICAGWDLGNKPLRDEPTTNSPVALCFVVILFLIGSLGAAVICGGIGLVRGEIGSLTPTTLGVAFVAGMFINTAAGVAWLKASLPGTDSSGNALGCAIPVLALIWLLVSVQADVARTDYVLIGATFVVTANMLISAQVEIRRGFRALVIALGLTGAFVYLRDEIFAVVRVNHWEWDLGGYFGSVGLSATVFTLLFAFRMARMYARDKDEAGLTFVIFRKLNSLVDRRIISPNVRDSIRDIDGARDRNSLDESKYRATLYNAYSGVREHIARANPRSDTDRDTLVQVESDLDALVRSKQGGQDLGEIFALVIFAGLTIFVTLSTKPEAVRGWAMLMVELFSILTSSVIIFLVEFIVGWGRERNRSKLNYEGAEDGVFVVAFPETEPHQVDRWLFIVIGVVILATYISLFGHKALA